MRATDILVLSQEPLVGLPAHAAEDDLLLDRSRYRCHGAFVCLHCNVQDSAQIVATSSRAAASINAGTIMRSAAWWTNRPLLQSVAAALVPYLTAVGIHRATAGGQPVLA